MKNQIVKRDHDAVVPFGASLFSGWPFSGRSLFEYDDFFKDIVTARAPYLVSDDGKTATYELEVPGARKDSLDANLSRGVLTISWKRKDEHRQIALTVPEGEIDAQLEDGLLTVKVTRNDPEVRKIAVR